MIEWSEVATVVSMIVAIGALYKSFKTAPVEMRNTSASTIKSLNESVDLAMDRAFVAEKALADEKIRFEKTLADERLVFQKMHDEEKEKTYLLEKRVAALESEVSNNEAIPYRISLEVVLGKNPSIQKGIIEHIAEKA